jgi:hypothetical protein
MKNILITIVLLISTFSMVAQKKSANDLLNEFGFTTDNVLSCIDLSSAAYSFKATSVTTTKQEANHSTSKNDKVYAYDATKKLGERFTLISVNGDTPRKKDFKHFDKEKNSVDEKQMQKLKEEDFFVKSDDETTAIIGFNIPTEQLNSKTAFMAHCTGYIFIDKQSGHITKIQIKSNEAFNLKIFHVTTMTIDIDLKYNDEHKQYYVSSENTMMKVLILGSITDFNIEENYSDFKFY